MTTLKITLIVKKFKYNAGRKTSLISVAGHLMPNDERGTRGSHAFKFVVPWAKKDIF